MKLFLYAAFAAVIMTTATPSAHAETPEEMACRVKYEACDARCKLEDPDKGVSYATCSAKCVSSKAVCVGGIIYDNSAEWTEKQYEKAKPWVKEKSKEAGEVADKASKKLDKALEDSKQEYPK